MAVNAFTTAPPPPGAAGVSGAIGTSQLHFAPRGSPFLDHGHSPPTAPNLGGPKSGYTSGPGHADPGSSKPSSEPTAAATAEPAIATFLRGSGQVVEAKVATAPTTDALPATSDLAAGAAEANSGFTDDWRTQAQDMWCSSCTGRNCGVCSIGVGKTSSRAPVGALPTGFQQANLNTDVDQGLLSSSESSSSSSSSPQARTFAAQAVGPNAIVLENQKIGNPQSEWGIDGAGDSNIEGFATNISLNHGERVDFKINTNSTHYRVDIYRIGYYDGMGARKVDSFERTLGVAQNQPDPLFDPVRKLVDAGNWAVSASWDIPTDAVSGVYFAKLTRLDGTAGENIIPFIVRDDDAPSDITFQTSDTTWQAYNWWGGYNFYGGIDQPGIAGRASAVSYNRPIITRGGGFAAGPQDFIFAVEYPAIRWLEQNGYDVDYIAGVDTDRAGGQLLNSKVFLSVGHDEYWSAQQRSNVEAARDTGVNLAFWSGNEIYWQVRWETSIDASGTPYRTLVCYKEIWDNANSDTLGTTSTFRDPNFGAGNPENGLTGTMFTVDSYRLDTIEIPYELSNFRFWSNTAVGNIQPGQTYSLVKNLLGYEWDSDLDNGFRPAGLLNLSSTTVAVNTLLLDNGTVTGPGTSTHALTLYRDDSGALVFGAGTVYWSWGLDSHHDLEQTAVDPNVQQAMVNLFADMGVQPETLVASLALASQSTDTAAPVSTITSPGTGASLTANQAITITGTAVDSGGGIVARVEVSTDGGATWKRASGFENWSYTWFPTAGGTYTIRTRAVDDTVNMETPGAGRTVTVAGSTTVSLFSGNDTPVVLSDADTNQVNLGVRFTSSQNGTITGLKFYKGTGDTGTHTGALWTATGTQLGTLTFTNETASGWQVATFTNPIAITAGTTYVAGYHSNGGYAATSNYFNTAHTSGPLTAPAANNGLYAYSNQLGLPTSTYAATNYWVDVLFQPQNAGPNHAPMAGNDNGFTTAQNTPLTISTATLLANDTDSDGDTLTISGLGAVSNGTVGFNAQGTAITFTPSNGYTGPATYGYSVSDGRGGTASAFVSITVTAPTPNQAPTAVNDTVGPATANTPLAISAATLLANDTDPNGDTLTVTGTSGATNGTATFNATSNTVTFTPTGGYTGPASFTYAISDGRGGVSSAVASLTVNAAPQSFSLFTTADTPAILNDPDTASVNLGVRFTSSQAGQITGLRYYKGAQDTGSHTGTLWTSTGTVLATATFTNETASGWQTLTFSSPVTITAGTTYVASYRSNGHYTATSNYFTTARTSGPLTASASTNGVYAYGTGNTFPNSTYEATNYWVDVVFVPGSNAAPVAANDSGFTTTQNAALVIGGATLLANDTDANGDPLSITGASGAVNGTVAFSAANNNVTFTPTTGYTGAASFTYAISDGRGGTSSATVSLTVTSGNAAPVATNDNGLTTAQNSALVISAATLLANDTDANGDPLSITGVSGGVNGTATFSTTNNSVTFTPTNGYAGPASFTYSITDGRGGTASATVNLTVTAPNQAPVAVNDSGLSTSQNTALAIAASTLLANDTDANGDTLSVTGVSNPVNGTVAFNAQTNVVTFTPTSGYTGPASFAYAISDGRGGVASATASLTVSAAVQTVSLFSGANTSGITSDADTNAVNLGVKFVSSQAGSITGIRYFKGAGDTGTHTGSLWSSAGTLLATATFVNETTSGWQTVTFTNPVAITAGTTYVASYHSNGRYSATSNYFATAQSNGPLTAPSSGTSGGNGVYTYGTGNLFPSNTFGSTNYWVDVVFAPQPTGPNQNPVAANDTGYATTQNTAVTIAASSLLANDTDADGDALSVTGVSGGVNGTATFNATNNVITFTPANGYTGPASFNYAISDGRQGVSSASVSLTVTAPAAQVGLFSDTATPTVIADGDTNAVELGMKFQSTAAGTISAIQFYKSPTNTGQHEVHLWSSTGTLLATAVATGETASGWQTVALPQAVAIQANTTYVASYHTNTGRYSADTNFFASSVNSGSLVAPSSASSGGNGVYAYGATGSFPTSTFNATNYWVDVVFNQLAA